MSALLLIACGFGAQPLPPEPPTVTPEEQSPAEIVVTGERVDRRLIDAPSSVSVFTAERLEAVPGADRLDDILTQSPNVQIGSGGEGPTIRGQDTTGVLRDLPAFLGGTRPRTTLQVDGRSVGFNEFVFGVAPLWDVEQVEVFRSPQTTTQGRNSIAGAIFIESKDPAYDWEGGGRLILGSEDLAQGSAVLSGPILPDRLAFRVAADVRRNRTSSLIADVIPDADPNQENHALIRAKLLVEPRLLPGGSLVLTYSHVETEAPQIQGVRSPFEQRRDPTPIYGVFATDVDSASAVLSAPLASDLTSKTTLAYGDGFIRRLARPGVGRSVSRTSDASVETVIRWQPSEALDAVAGAHLLEASLDQQLDLSVSIGTGAFTDDQSSLGLFGEVAVQVAPRLDLGVGLRHQRDRQVRTGSIGNERASFEIDYDGTFEAWLPKLTLTYAPSDEVRVGAMIQRAYNPGGATIRLDTGATDTFEAETLWAYELFGRASLMGGRLTARANLFYNEITNAQRPNARTVFLPGGIPVLVTDIANAPAAETYGLELEVSAPPTRSLSVNIGLGLLRTRTLRTVAPDDPFLGKEFQRAPHLTASASVQWRPIESLRLSFAARHNSGYFSDDANTPNRRIEASTVLDARAAWEIGSVTLFAYARNVTDQFYLTYLFNEASGTAGDPRQIGIGIEARF